MTSLTITAGPLAYRKIRENGLTPGMVRKVVGASGGAKWLVLRQIDKVVFGDFLKGSDHQIDLIGSSIGSWRMTLAAMRDPAQEFQRFEDIYLSYRYENGMTVDDVTRDSWAMARDLLPQDKCEEALGNPNRNLNIVAVRCKGIAAMESRVPLAASLLVTAGLNALSRRTLGLFYDRVVLHSHDEGVEGFDGFSRQDIRLTPGNLHAAILASGSIPFVMHGIQDFEGAGPGVYRDGGFTDYHFDEPWSVGDGIVLYPHFYDHLVPGWFDKGLKSRRASGAAGLSSLPRSGQQQW